MVDVDQAAARVAGGSRFALVTAVAKRANDLAQHPLRRKAVAHALTEAAEGRYTIRPKE